MDTSFPPEPQNSGTPEMANPRVREAVQAGHEILDVSVPGLFAFVIGFFISLVAILITLVVVFRIYSWVNTRVDERIARNEPGAAARVHLPTGYEGPLLQVKPEEDLRWMREHDAAELQSYRWLDRSGGVVHLPITRAMDLLAERGLPPVAPHHTLEELQRMRAQPQVYGQSLRP